MLTHRVYHARSSSQRAHLLVFLSSCRHGVRPTLSTVLLCQQVHVLTRNRSWRILTCCRSHEVTSRGAVWKELWIVACFLDQADPIVALGHVVRRSKLNGSCCDAGERSVSMCTCTCFFIYFYFFDVCLQSRRNFETVGRPLFFFHTVCK